MGDYLDNYFGTGIQATPSATALSGSADGEANSQILMKTSAYWVAVTHVMYNLDMAEKNLAANNTAAAASNFDSAAAAYYGCGDTNPVPLPFYKGSVIKYSATAATLTLALTPPQCLSMASRTSVLTTTALKASCQLLAVRARSRAQPAKRLLHSIP